MKLKSLLLKMTVLYFFLFGSVLMAQQYPHIPVGHNHTGTPICWAYATVRTFQHFGQVHSGCNAATASGITGLSGNSYFTRYSWSLSGVQVGDIVEFREGTQDHAAYVSSKYSSTNNGIILDQLDGGTEKTGYTLQQTIDGVQGTLTARGNPTGYFRLKKRYQIKLENNMGDGSNGGKVKLSGFSNEENSPHTYGDFHWDTKRTLYGVMDSTTYGNYKQSFYQWSGDGDIWSSKDPEITIKWYTISPKTFKAYYKNLYNTTFRNQFTGVSGYPGTIKVGGSSKSSPYVEEVKDGHSVQGEAVNQTYNGIIYTFDEWDDHSTTNPRTWSPTSNATHTAKFNGKPKSMYYYNLEVVGDPGDPVTLDWDEHPNTGVTQYKIWRKVKHNGQMGNPQLIATRNRGTTSYTDYDYHLTNGYTADLLYYDVKAYYSTEGTYSDPEWIDAFGEEFAKRSLLYSKNTLPEDFSISNFPNPFNPTTTISFSLIEDSYVTLKVYNISGQEVSSLFAGKLRAGVYKYGWNGKNLNGSSVAGGMYIAKLLIKPKYGERILLTRKMLLTK